MPRRLREALGGSDGQGGMVPAGAQGMTPGGNPMSLAAPTDRDWMTAPLTEFLDYIVSRHHSYTREALSRLAALMGQTPKNGLGGNLETARRAEALFEALRTRLDHHLLAEESNAFPMMRRMAAAGQAVSEAMQGRSASYLLQHLSGEHGIMHKLVSETQQLLSSYAASQQTSPTFSEFRNLLGALGADLIQHSHLEDDVLFPRVRALESGSAGEAN
jgi:regulator of cell morphogenesis and NO signaling